MVKPPPPPPSLAARSQVQAFGDAFEAAVSRMDGEVGVVDDGVPEAKDGSGSGEVYANDLEIRGVYTGPYTEVPDLPPSLGHLGAPDLKTLKTQALPLELRHTSARVQPDSSSGALKLLLLVAVIAAGVVFALKAGAI